ncbi:CbiX/SirB N-terminal domain-containing protein [Leifsonia sp. fls2-241-R2A-40a]|uniref:sirohydrochlorin chelatase n=1 Tax=Leifsonia sp. fls2-241-R2A-40a TaxID=3040290 RepID=UPI00254C24F8|nr:CbiX/SirB N-terminal domain-containing protein [Leifsonia sp. fls2-241-R2A-40a]
MTGLVLAASHGTSSPEGQAAVRRLVERVADSLPVRVVGCHVDVEQPDVPTALGQSSNEVDHATIVPLLLSAGYHVFVDLAESADASPVPTTVAPALGPDPRLAAVLAQRLTEAGLRPDDSIVLAAAGSTDTRAVGDCERMGELLGSHLGRPVSVGFISAAAPRLADAVSAARSRNPGRRVLIATYLLAPGYFASLAGQAGGDVVTAPLLTAEHTPLELVEIVMARAVLATA